jgi:hypothetical protein
MMRMMREEEEKKPKFKRFGSIVGVSSYSTHVLT